MKIYVVYLRTMVDSPDVQIIGATNRNDKAEQLLCVAKNMEDEFMAEEDEESGNWAEAGIKEFDGLVPMENGDKLFLGVFTLWVEGVTTEFYLGKSAASVLRWISNKKGFAVHEDPDLEPFDEDETIEESMHLCNPDVMSDLYFSVELITIE